MGGVEHGAIRASACACAHVCRVSVSRVCVVCVSNAHPIRACGVCTGRGLLWPCGLVGRRTLAAMAGRGPQSRALPALGAWSLVGARTFFIRNGRHLF